jgi:hypothetical protein
VRHLVAGHVQRRAEQEGKRPRADERYHRGAGRYVQGDDHTGMIAYARALLLG